MSTLIKNNKKRKKEEEIITWETDDKNRGYRTIGENKRIIYKLDYAIRLTIHASCKVLILTFEAWNDKIPFQGIRHRFSYLNSVHPPLNFGPHGTLKTITKLTPPVLNKALKKYTFEDKTISDFVFLALLGKKRNWKEQCAICLCDKIMGTTCGCGHTEIIVFRPCGHSVCNSPCFKTFMTTQNIKLKPKLFKCGDQTFVCPGVHETKNVSGFKCHYCRANVDSIFRAEDVYCDLTDEELGMTDLIERANNSYPPEEYSPKKEEKKIKK